jgi:hypothetical protein
MPILRNTFAALSLQFQSAVFTVIWLSLVTAIIAVFVQAKFAISVTVAALWFTGVLLVFHAILWHSRSTTTQNHLRSLEYVYITIGLLGALSVIELKSSLFEMEKLIITTPYGDVRSSWCDKFNLEQKKSSLEHEEWIICALEHESRSTGHNYDHSRIRKFLDEFYKHRGEAAPEARKYQDIMAKGLESVWSSMDDLYKKYGFSPKREGFILEKEFEAYNWLSVRLVGFYLILVGVAIKFAKTTAEIRKWHVQDSTASNEPKRSPSNT